MKYIIFRFFLKVFRGVAVRIQVGNPAGKAPTLIDKPDEIEKLKSIGSTLEDIAVWNLKKVICCVSFHNHVSLSYAIIINRQNQVYNRFVNFPWGNELHPALTLPYLGRRSLKIDKAILLMTPEAKGNYYHWIADLLPRLLLIKQYEITDFNERMIILHNPARRYEDETLNLLEIKQNKVTRVNSFEFVEVNDLIVADYVNYGMVFPDWKRQLLNDFKKKIVGLSVNSSCKNIYLLRGKQSKRRLVGEERLASFLRGIGFQILDPEQMSLVEQISAFTNAEIVIASHGAALTNIIFCEESTLIIELRSINNPPEFFSEIAKTCKLRFDSISLFPESVHKSAHADNKQNLLLTDHSLSILKDKLSAIVQ